MIAPTLDNLVPKLTIPTVASLIHGQNLATKSPEDQMFEKIAERQIDEEKNDTNFFFQMLDYLGRPQAAVAGVLKDAIDGGDFSPLDRVGRALAGKERYRVKDLIDVVAPGKWSNMKLPDWLGGKDVDPAKETLGFVGDVLTDPLMATRLFSFIGKTAKFAGEEAALLRKIGQAETLGGAEGTINRQLAEAVSREHQALGIADNAAAKIARERVELRELHNIWERVVQDPDAFRASLASDEARKEFDVLRQSFTHRASPLKSERYAAGEQALLAVKMPWLMRKLGLPDGKWSLIPKLDKVWGDVVAKGFENRMAHILTTPVGIHTKELLSTIFRTGTGSKAGDYISATMLQNARIPLQEAEGLMTDMRKALGSDYNEDLGKVIANNLFHTEDLLGNELRVTSIQVPDPVLRQKVQNTVDGMRKIIDDRGRIHQEIPGALKHKLIQGLDNPKDRYRAWSQKVLKEAGKERAAEIIPFPQISQMARKYARQETKYQALTMGVTGKEALKDLRRSLYKNEAERIILEEIERGRSWVNDMIPLQETAYFPRTLTQEAKAMFQNVLFNPRVLYKGRPAGDVFFNHFKTRNLVQYDIHRWNSMFKEMERGDFPGIMQEVVDSANKNLKGRDRQMFKKFFGELEPAQMKMYMDDPFQVVSRYLIGSIRAVSDQERMNAMTKIFARPLGAEEMIPLWGEKPVILSPEGMEAVYGKDWRNMLGEAASKVYDENIARTRTRGRQDLGGLFFDYENELHHISMMKAYNIPIHAIPGVIYDDLAKLERLHREPASWSPFLKAWDEVTSWWKAWTLAVFPSYHVRNLFSGFWQSFLGDSLEVKNYQLAGRTFWAGRGYKLGTPVGRETLDLASESLDDIVITRSAYNGQPFTARNAMQEMLKYDAFQAGFISEELINQAKGGHLEPHWKFLNKKNPALVAAKELTHRGKIVGAGFWAGNMADNWHRLSHFIDRIRKGATPYEAVQSVKKYFFDYRELGTVERAVFRRAFPFYTWARKNTPLQLEAIATKPGKFAQLQRSIEFFQSDEAKNFDQKLLPKWVSANLGVPTRIDKKLGNVEVKLLNTWVPAADLKNMSSLNAFFENLVTLAHPLPKLLAEVEANYSTFTRKPIEDYPGEPYNMPFLGMDLSKMTVHKLKTLRLASTLNDLVSRQRPGGEVPFEARFYGFLGATPKTKVFNIEDLEKTRQYEVNVRKGLLKRGYRRTGKVSSEQQQKFVRRVKNAAGLDLD